MVVETNGTIIRTLGWQPVSGGVISRIVLLSHSEYATLSFAPRALCNLPGSCTYLLHIVSNVDQCESYYNQLKFSQSSLTPHDFSCRLYKV